MIGKTERKTRISWADRVNNNTKSLGAHYKIRTEKTGHFFMHGTITDKTRYVWICVHGYGQLGKYFSQKFEFLDPAINYVLVPEGLNRFYFEGVNERPVASWMTKEDRLDEIADYVLFLEALRMKLSWDKNPEVKVIYVGFSQGVNTLIRWMANVHQRCDHLLLWAGMLPDDILYEQHKAYFSTIPTDYFIGKQDPYFNEERANEIIQLINKSGLQTRVQRFEGDHRVDENVLKNWIAVYVRS